MIFNLLVRFYKLLVHLYPVEFRERYGDELESVFEATLKGAIQGGFWDIAAVCLRELRDLPGNLLRTHLEEKHMNNVLHTRPVRFALKGAIGFGLSFVIVNMIYTFLQGLFFGFQERIITWLCGNFLPRMGLGQASNRLSSLFHGRTQVWFFLANEWVAWAFVSILGGLLFAAMLGEKGKFRRYMAWGFLGWFIPGLLSLGLFRYLGNDSILLDSKAQFINTIAGILTGAFLGWALGRTTEARLKKLAFVLAGAILYPLLSGLFLQAFKYLPIPYSWNYLVSIGLSYVLAGVAFGFLMGLILGWDRKLKPAL